MKFDQDVQVIFAGQVLSVVTFGNHMELLILDNIVLNTELHLRLRFHIPRKMNACLAEYLAQFNVVDTKLI